MKKAVLKLRCYKVIQFHSLSLFLCFSHFIHKYTEYTTVEISVGFLTLFSKDTLNELKMTAKTFIMVQNISIANKCNVIQ